MEGIEVRRYPAAGLRNHPVANQQYLFKVKMNALATRGQQKDKQDIIWLPSNGDLKDASSPEDRGITARNVGTAVLSFSDLKPLFQAKGFNIASCVDKAKVYQESLKNMTPEQFVDHQDLSKRIVLAGRNGLLPATQEIPTFDAPQAGRS